MKEKDKVAIRRRKRREPEAKRRARMLKSAEKLFLHQGYSGTSMRDIARGAKVALGNLYNHFSSKEDIFDALIEAHSPARELSELIEIVEIEKFPSNLFELAKALKEIVERNSVFIRLTDIDGIEFGGRKTSKIIKKTVEMVGAPFFELYRKHAGQNLVRKFDPFVGLPFVALMLVAIFVVRDRFGESGLFDKRLREDDYDLKQITDIILYGITPRENVRVD